MDVGVPSFPLLSLPKDAQVHVLRNMTYIQLTGISLCSVKAKDIIRSLNLKLQRVTVEFRGFISIECHIKYPSSVKFEFFVDEARNWLRGNNLATIGQPMLDFVDINEYANQQITRYRWKQTGFTVRDWLFHILLIFHYSKIDDVWIEDNYDLIFDIESIQSIVYGLSLRTLRIRNVRPNQAFEQVFENLLPTKNLSLMRNPLESRESIHKIFCQHFDLITLGSDFDEKLNDLLAMNSREIRLHRSKLPGNSLNPFLKHWINGSNPRLKHFRIHFDNTSDVTVLEEKHVLKGIKYQVIPVEKAISIQVTNSYSDGFVTWTFKGGFHIQRRDGTKATVSLINRDHERHFAMYVWS